MTHVVGLYLDQEARELARYNEGARSVVDVYLKTLWYKAHTRDRKYIAELFAERYPQGAFICLDDRVDWLGKAAEADTVVLLYPDPIGLGLLEVERALRGRLRPWAAVRVLNGRRRDFVLSRGTWWTLRWRRFLARTMLMEAAFLCVFVMTTPYLLLKQKLGGGHGR